MNPWLYQMAEDEDWTPDDFRLTVWEGEPVTWSHKKVMPAASLKPAPGDPVVFFFAKSRTKAPGICGWGVIVKAYPKKEEFTFRAVFPTDLLKMNPIWDNEIEELINNVRGPHPRGTTWAMSADAYGSCARRIRAYASAARA
jgi:hypothetical protein